MSLQILIDMNLSPDWVDELSKHGWAAVHWSAIGVAALKQHETDLSSGALVVIDESKSRVRVLPI